MCIFRQWSRKILNTNLIANLVTGVNYCMSYWITQTIYAFGSCVHRANNPWLPIDQLKTIFNRFKRINTQYKISSLMIASYIPQQKQMAATHRDDRAHPIRSTGID